MLSHRRKDEGVLIMRRLLFSVIFLFGSFSFAEVLNIKLKDGISRTVERIYGSADKPTVVLVNGLVYNYERWDPMVEILKAKDYSIIRYYFRGQHQTLVNEIEKDTIPQFFAQGLSSEQMGDELSEILKALKVEKPVVVVGLSYGAHVAAQLAERHPKQVEQLVLLAPLVRSLDKYDAQGAFLAWNLEQIKFWWGPVLGPAFYEYAYGMIYRGYLNLRIMPDRIPEELQSFPFQYKESIFHLVRAVRDFDLRTFKFAKLAPRSVTYILAHEESSLVFDEQKQAAQNLKKRNLQSLVYLPEATHAIPDSQGRVAAEIIDRLVQREEGLSKGEAFILDKGQLNPWNQVR